MKMFKIVLFLINGDKEFTTVKANDLNHAECLVINEIHNESPNGFYRTTNDIYVNTRHIVKIVGSGILKFHSDV